MIVTRFDELLRGDVVPSAVEEALRKSCPKLLQWCDAGNGLSKKVLIEQLVNKWKEDLKVSLADVFAGRIGRASYITEPQQVTLNLPLICFGELRPDMPTADIEVVATLTREVGSIREDRRTGHLEFMQPERPWTCELVATIRDTATDLPASVFYSGRLADVELPAKVEFVGPGPAPDAAGRTARLALIAVIADSESERPGYKAVVVGTSAPREAQGGQPEVRDGEYWRAAVWSLSDLKRELAQQSSKGTADWPFVNPGDTSLGAYQGSPSSDELSSNGSGIEWPKIWNSETAGLNSALFTNVVQVLFLHSRDGRAVGDVLARLETCRAVRADEAAANAKDENRPVFDFGSFLQVLYSPTGQIHALRAILDVKLAVNSHTIVTTPHGDALDTRGRVVLSREYSPERPNIWCSMRSGHVPAGRSLQFDHVAMGWTTAPVYRRPSGNAARFMEKVRPERAPQRGPFDLAELAGFRHGTRASVADGSRVRGPASTNQSVPWLNDLGVRQPRSGWTCSREFGFRLVALPTPDARKAPAARVLDGPQVVLRFENKVEGLASSLLGTSSFQGFVPRTMKPGDERVWLAQEQRIGDLNSSLLPDEPVRWIATVRVDEDNWKARVNAEGTAAQRTDLSGHLINRLREASTDVRDGLQVISPARSVSLLPAPEASHRVDEDRSQPWHFVTLLTEHFAHHRNAPLRPVSQPQPFFWRRTTDALSFEPRFINNMWSGAQNPEKINEELLNAELPSFRDESGSVVKCAIQFAPPRTVSGLDGTASCTMAPAWQPAVSAADNPGDVVAGMRIGTRVSEVTSARNPPQFVTLGAMRLVLSKDFSDEDQRDRYGLILEPRFSELPDGTDSRGLSAVIRLPVRRIDPAAQDLSEAESRAELPGYQLQSRSALQGFVFDMRRLEEGKPKVHYTLIAQESLSSEENHTLSMSVRAHKRVPAATGSSSEDRPEKSRRRVLVLDMHPFRAAMVEYQELASAISDESAEVAVWNAEGEGGLAWRVRDDAQQIDVVLPPQVIGEAMEKFRNDDSDLPADITVGRPVAARFASNARLRIDPTYADTQFREPGWNLRRILGNALQRSPGARLNELRIELLYGLVGSVRASDLWLTEIGGAVGLPPSPLPGLFDGSGSHRKRYRRLVNQVLAAERSRISVDKVWRDRPDDFVVIDKDVEFRLRTHEPDSARSDAPHGTETPFRWPVPGSIPTGDTGGLIDPKVLRDSFSTGDGAFAGGVAWAFQSANVLMSVYGNLQAEGGRLQGVYLSALGGYGQQRALFDQRKTIIESDTSQGRVHRYRLERIGRIACLWHRAKHVIVFERSVVPAGQFYNRTPIELKQDEHLGRAILRKVEEYVEILEPIRRYPEGDHQPQNSGCIVGAEFKSTKIRVDSDWGADVRREGWEVPLWNRDFAVDGPVANSVADDSPARIYPKPQVRVLLATEGGGYTPVEVEEPEKLYFYTSVVRGDDDNTDAWPSVREVDFADAPPMAVSSVSFRSEDLHDGTLPGEPDHVPGYERFTLGLVKSEVVAALTHGRHDAGPQASLRSVTVARSGALVPEVQPEEKAGKAVAIGAEIAQATANLRSRLDLEVGRLLGKLESAPDVKALSNLLSRGLRELRSNLGDGAQFVDDAKHALDAARNLVERIGPKDCEGLREGVSRQVSAQFDKLATIGRLTIESASRDARDLIAPIAGIPASVRLLSSTMTGVLEAIDQLENSTAEQWISVTAIAIENVRGARNVVSDAASMLDQNRRNNALAAHKEHAIQTVRLLVGDPKDHAERAKQAAATVALGASTDVVEIIEEESRNLKAICDDAQGRLTANVWRDELESLVRESSEELDGMILALRKQESKLKSPARDVVLKVLERCDVLRTELRRGRWRTAPEAELAQVRITLEATLGGLSHAISEVSGGLSNRVTQLFGAAKKPVFEASEAAAKVLGSGVKVAEELIRDACDVAQGASGELQLSLGGLQQLVKDAQAKVEALGEWLNEHRDTPDSLTAVRQELADIRKAVAACADNVIAFAGKQESALDAEVGAAYVELSKVLRTAETNFEDFVIASRASMEAGLAKVLEPAFNQCEALEGMLRNQLADAEAAANELKERLGIAQLQDQLEAELNDLLANASHAEDTLHQMKERLQSTAAAAVDRAEARARDYAGSLQQELARAIRRDPAELHERAEGLYQKGDAVFRTLRALGDPPKTDSLGFNRPKVAYLFGQADRLGIRMTPALALANRTADRIAAVRTAGRAVGDLLDSFGVRLPTTEIANQLIPQKLKGLSVADLLPDMGGIDFKGLLKGVGFPDLERDQDAIRITHGFDEKSMTAWMDASIDVPFGSKPVSLMAFGPVQIIVDRARFTSNARLEQSSEGTNKIADGQIYGDWRVMCSGQVLMTFTRTALTFDKRGRFDFRLQADRVELAPTMKFLTDLMKATGKKGEVQVGPLMRGSIPAGVAATLDLDLPDIQSGAFGVTDLSLHVLFGVAAAPRFELMTELSLGQQLAPFTLNVWILNGGGYLVSRMSYQPAARPKPILCFDLDVAIVAGVGMGFNFGVVSGGVWLQVGCAVLVHWTTERGGSSTSVRVFILARGNVDVAGLITASIALMLDITYNGNTMIGAGTLSIKAKISRFYTLRVRQRVTYKFAGGSQKQDDGSEYADAYC